MRKSLLLYSVVLLVTILLAGAAVADTPRAAATKASPVSPFADPEPLGQLVPPAPELAPSGMATIYTVPGSYATIQAAILAASSGDTIVVGSGTYPEDILIDGKSLTITGAGTGISIITGSSSNTQYIVKITNGATVNFSGFTVDGTGKNILYGVWATVSTDGNIHHNEIKNVSSPGAAGLAVRREDSQIDVQYNNVYGFGRVGIYTRDDVIGNTDGGVISYNVVTGLGGSDPDRLNYGISVYSGNPTIDNNDVSECVSGTNVATWASSGIDVWGPSTTTITNNYIHDSDNGIVVLNATPTMSGNTFSTIAMEEVRLDFCVKGNPTPYLPLEYYDTIQQAIDAIPSTTYRCIVWIGIYSGGGTYNEAVNVNKSCEIYGYYYDRSAVTINPVGYSVNNAGIYVAADNVTLYGFTLVGSLTNSLPRYGVKFADVDGCWLWDVEVRNLYRTGVDILGATNLGIGEVYSHDNGGNGIQMCDAVDVELTDITTAGNAWGGVGIFTYGQYTPIGTSGIVFSGTNSFGETTDDVGSIYLEQGNFATPSSPYPITYSTNPLDGADVTLQLADVTHALHGDSDNSNLYVRFYDTLADAQAAAAGAVSHIMGDRYIEELGGTNLYVPGNQGGIQAAIDAASPYDVIHVAAGTYDERIVVNKALTLKGATNGVSKKGFAVPSGYAYDPMTQSIIKPSTDVGDVTVVQIAADEVVFDGFIVANEVCATGGVYRDLITINQNLIAPTGIQILNNVLGPNTNTLSQDGTMSRSGICAPGPRTVALKLIAKNNKIFDVKGNGCGIMIVGPYGPTYHGGTSYTNLFSGSVIENNEITGIHRTGIELAGGVQGGSATADYIMIRNNLITNNGWFSLADMVNLKYGHGIMFIRGGGDKANCDGSGSRYISLTGNVITGNEKSGVYIGPMNKDLFWTNNTIANNGLGTGGYSLWDGVRIDLDESYYGLPANACNYTYLTNIPFSNNSLSGNGDYGMRVIQTPTLGPVSASYNWWGAALGPQHPTSNPLGTGNDVSNNVTFIPYMTGEYEISLVPATGLTNCATPITYTYRITQAGAGTPIRGYDVKFDVDNAVVTVTNPTPSTPPVPADDIVQLPYLSSVGGTSFFVLDGGSGTYTVSCAILGPTAGRTGDGDLFTVKLTPVAQGTSAITSVNLKLRDVNNLPISVGGTGGSVQVDCTLPTMEAIAEVQNVCYKTAPTFANFGFDDDVNLDLAEYKIDSGSWTTIFTGINAAFWDSDGWVLPGFAGLSEGSHTVYFQVKDDAGNWDGMSYSWSFVKDTVAPAAPTNFVALPGYNKVHLTWTNTTTDFVGVEIRRVAWGDYADYAGSGPSYPANPTEGTLVTQTALAAYDNAVTPRDIYYYAAFTYDCAGNYSLAATTARDRSTSYWLGDINPALSGDGTIDIVDLSIFAALFGKVDGGGGWNEEGDFGPTDDWSRFGIPMPDNVVDFEDLMIFAMNYANVSPSGTSGGLIALAAGVPLGEQVSFRLVPISREDGKTTYAVVVENGSEILKGFSLKVAYGAGNGLEGVTASREMTGKGSEHFFGVIERETGVVEICVAALGVNQPFEYTGEVARIVVREETEGSVGLKTADLRDVNNGRDEVTLPGGGGETPYIPVTTALLQNHPNPFNPTTMIPYEVATAGHVELSIYDVSGSLVRTLVSGEKGIGRHVATWDGRDGAGSQVHTGVYFYRMTAPGYTSQAKKMLLLK